MPMKDNNRLKRGLILQSLSIVFVLLIIRHSHLDYFRLFRRFVELFKVSPSDVVYISINHERFGELLIVFIGFIWIIVSIISLSAFKATQIAGFESHGEQVIVIEEKRDAAASFLMTFILPLLIDELNCPQNWISYIIVIAVVYAVLYQSNLYYQSPILSLLGYKFFSFKVLNPYEKSGMKSGVDYIGITKRHMITEESSIMWKHISDNVFLVYNE